MKPVRIVGGGLTGILAAFQAHRLGARQIELHERLDRLGGVALPKLENGREMREGCIYFGPEGDPIRTLLEEHGAIFEDFDNRFGSVSPGAYGPVYLDDFGGPALPATKTDLQPLSGNSLGDRLDCYEDALAFPLARYVRWHVGCAPSKLHADAAIPLAINRVFPTGIPLDTLSASKRADGHANELFGIPRSMWNYSSNVQASLPVGGFTSLIDKCREALDAIGVEVNERSLARPNKLLSEIAPDEVLVWAASPMPLFKAVGLEAPKAPAKKFATYTFEVDWTGAKPFYVQNFTTDGSCFRVYIYESRGATLLTAECVAETESDELAKDIRFLLDGFEGELKICDQLYRSIKPRWLYHTVDTVNKLGELRTALGARLGDNFVAGAWEAYAKGAKFAEVEADLQKAFGVRMIAKAS
ncbi:NAD(P)-binding protein [Erythrobacter rubeus]|uniref:NAD(P)-binding protein n=1 Tax=Erythrobacter rubeus TaxID=2760803 RepID=A0ABR8KP20_9SPHN|nr:NAD(P)-binding protein [Erythrobacter rubeus]MBD2842453.1 NAD(P)-binding protein [Erythrobacter rubeus]